MLRRARGGTSFGGSRESSGAVRAVGRPEAEASLASKNVTALRKAAASYEATTGVGVNGSHPRVPLDVSDECCGRTLRLLHKVEMAGVRPSNASTTLFFLILKSATSKRQECGTRARRW